MVRQDTPGIQILRECFTSVQERRFALGHAIRIFADYVSMLITRSGNQVLMQAGEILVGRRMPGKFASSPKSESFLSLRFSELSPIVHAQGLLAGCGKDKLVYGHWVISSCQTFCIRLGRIGAHQRKLKFELRTSGAPSRLLHSFRSSGRAPTQTEV